MVSGSLLAPINPKGLRIQDLIQPLIIKPYVISNILPSVSWSVPQNIVGSVSVFSSSGAHTSPNYQETVVNQWIRRLKTSLSANREQSESSSDCSGWKSLKSTWQAGRFSKPQSAATFFKPKHAPQTEQTNSLLFYEPSLNRTQCSFQVFVMTAGAKDLAGFTPQPVIGSCKAIKTEWTNWCSLHPNSSFII